MRGYSSKRPNACLHGSLNKASHLKVKVPFVVSPIIEFTFKQRPIRKITEDVYIFITYQGNMTMKH